MKAILVDDEAIAMNMFEVETEDIVDFEIVGKFENPSEALEFLKNRKADLAVLDICMPGMDGIQLGEKMREFCPELMLIYITGSEDYALDSFRLHAAAYLLKPFSKEEIEYAVESARLLSKRFKKRIYARTFGHFDLFVDGKPIMFHSAKAKELLALLIDRQGGTVNSEQIISILWEDRPNDEYTQNLCSKICKTLKKELKEYRAEEILITSRGLRRVDTELFECDLYQLLNGENEKGYFGEYMIDYSWGEYRMAALDKYLR